MSSALRPGLMEYSPSGGPPQEGGGESPTRTVRPRIARTRASPIAAHRDRSENAAMTSAAPIAPRTAAADWHRRQRDLVAASLVACPSSGRPTHRRWA